MIHVIKAVLGKGMGMSETFGTFLTNSIDHLPMYIFCFYFLSSQAASQTLAAPESLITIHHYSIEYVYPCYFPSENEYQFQYKSFPHAATRLISEGSRNHHRI